MQKRTIDDIAKEAHVSKATVSRVLSKPSVVKESTRNRVLSIIDKYGYVPNQLAQGLAGTPTKTIGVVIDELSNDFFTEIAEGIDNILSLHDFSMQLSSSKWVEEKEVSIVRNLISSKVDGILLAPVSVHSKSIAILKRSGIPFLLINCKTDDKCGFIGCNNIAGGKIAAEFISSHPKDQTILITGFEHQSLNDRIEGFHSAYNCEAPIKHYPHIKTFEDGYNLVPILLTRDAIKTKTTTLFVTNDNVAIGIISGLLEHDVSIPSQVSIIGYDNIRLASFCRIPLTTISQSIKSMGKIAAMELLELIEHKDKIPPQHLIEPQIIIRETTEELY